MKISCPHCPALFQVASVAFRLSRPTVKCPQCLYRFRPVIQQGRVDKAKTLLVKKVAEGEERDG